MRGFAIEVATYTNQNRFVRVQVDPLSSMLEVIESCSQRLKTRVLSLWDQMGNRIALASDLCENQIVFASSSDVPLRTSNQIQQLSMISQGKHSRSFRTVILGPPTVGKTALVYRFVFDSFTVDGNPTIMSVWTKERYIHQDKEFNIDILDTAGQEAFFAAYSKWISGQDAYILAISIENLDVKEINRIFDLILQADENPVVALVVTKFDLYDSMDSKEQTAIDLQLDSIRLLASQNNWIFIPTSAKTNWNVQSLFQKLLDAKFFPAPPSLDPAPTLQPLKETKTEAVLTRLLRICRCW